MVLNPTMCRNLEMRPWDFRQITSLTDCLQGGIIGGFQTIRFHLDSAEWFVKIRCSQSDPESDVWLR
jgi:hypothetical protein